MRIPKEQQIKRLAPLLKAAGYRKKAGTWHRGTGEGVHVVNIQGSQWGVEYYLNVGFYLRALGDEATPPAYRCHVQSRLDKPDRDCAMLVEEIEKWFLMNGTVEQLIKLQKAGSLPLVTTGQAVEYLAQHSNPLQATR